MTYNVGNGRAQPHRLKTLLSTCRADVIALQELCDDQAAAVETGLKELYPYQALYPGGFAGKGLVSRWPIIQAELKQLGPERPDLYGVIDIEGLPLSVINAHPPPPHLTPRGLHFTPSTWREIQSLAALAQTNDPAVLLGDFNLIASRPEYAYILSTGLGDVFAEAGSGKGRTLPRRLGPWKRYLWLNRMLRWLPLPPLLRVDYIWRTPSLVALNAWIGDDAGSDHLPLLSKLAVRTA